VRYSDHLFARTGLILAVVARHIELNECLPTDHLPSSYGTEHCAGTRTDLCRVRSNDDAAVVQKSTDMTNFGWLRHIRTEKLSEHSCHLEQK